MTGLGMLARLAIGPDGQRVRPFWGPAFHTSSNFDKPGDEWGATSLPSLDAGTCAVRGSATADV
jgi:hypothetical protein